MNVIASRTFVLGLKKLSKNDLILKRKIVKTIQLLENNPKHPSLRLHKLVTQETYSVSVTMKIRIIFAIREGKILLLKIGDHDEVY